MYCEGYTPRKLLLSVAFSGKIKLIVNVKKEIQFVKLRYKRKTLKYGVIFLAIITIQTITYFTIGQKLLKNKLLPDYFATLALQSDSLIVRDFYIADCYVGDTKIYSSHNLKDDELFLKSKFNVKNIYFQSSENINDTIENKFNLIYNTWLERNEWFRMLNIYETTQTEVLITQRKYFYRRETHYRWILFFWIKTFERFESRDFR